VVRKELLSLGVKIVALLNAVTVGGSFVDQAMELNLLAAVELAQAAGCVTRLSPGQTQEVALSRKRVQISAGNEGGRVEEFAILPKGVRGFLQRITHWGKKSLCQTLPPYDHVRIGEKRALHPVDIMAPSQFVKDVFYVVILHSDEPLLLPPFPSAPASLVPIQE
jgi:hypothetical protein